MTTDETPTPGIRIFPPLLYIGFLLVGGLAEFLLPIASFPLVPRLTAGITLAASAFLFVLPAMRLFRRAETPFNVRKAATSLVVDGPFRLSRNPVYLALTLLYLGIGVMAGSLWILALLVPVLAIMHRAVILREEQNLEQLFGEEYLSYKARVRRWL